MIAGVLIVGTALMIPVHSAATSAAKKELCAANLSKSVQALQQYGEDNGGFIPLYMARYSGEKVPADERANNYTWMGTLYRAGYLPDADPAARCPQMGEKMVLAKRTGFYTNSSYGALTSNKMMNTAKARLQYRISGPRSQWRGVVTANLLAAGTFPLLIDTVDTSGKTLNEFWAYEPAASGKYGMHARHENMVQAAFADGSVAAKTPEDYRSYVQASGFFGNVENKCGYFDLEGKKITL